MSEEGSSYSRDEKRRRKDAKKALLAFMRRAKRVCHKVQTADEWLGLVEPLGSIIDAYENVLSATDCQRLRQAMSVAGVGRAGLSRACDVLRFELEHVVSGLPSAGALGTIALAGATVVVVAAGMIAMNASSARVTLRNEGCDPIPLMSGVIPGLDWVLGAVGVSLPSMPIPDGGEETITLPPVSLEIDCSAGQTCEIEVLGRSVPIPLGHRVQRLDLDGEPLLGHAKRLRLTPRSEHELIVGCK